MHAAFIGMPGMHTNGELPGNFGMQGVVFGDTRTHANQFWHVVAR
jgi:hypothetical protein